MSDTREAVVAEVVEEPKGALVTTGTGQAPMIAEFSVAQVRAQINKIQELMDDAMVVDVHYGKIPGVEKPSLFKPGAEKINFIFRIADTNTRLERIELPGGHREYIVTKDMVHIPTGKLVSQGVGSCSTMESKYRYRTMYNETEVGAVPRQYWDARKIDQKAANEILVTAFGAGKYRTKKDATGNWLVYRVEGSGERVENPDIADQYNTVLKMADKRCYVCGTLKATAASDFFTQDVEDMAEPNGHGEKARPEKKAEAKPAAEPTAVQQQMKANAEKKAASPELRAAADELSNTKATLDDSNMFSADELKAKSAEGHTVVAGGDVKAVQALGAKWLNELFDRQDKFLKAQETGVKGGKS